MSTETNEKQKEKILLTVNTFKKLCLKARTSKADEIHDYYIKMEDIIHEIMEETSDTLKRQLLIKEEELNNKELLIEKQQNEINQLKKKKCHLYIGTTPIYTDLIKVGITEDLTSRLEQHRTSNPKFDYLFTYKSDNVNQIETMIKMFLKNWRCRKPEWFNVTYKQCKDIVDFCVMMYDSYNINEDVDNLVNFISRYRKNRLVNHSYSRQYFLETQYKKWFNENVIFKENVKTPLCIMMNDFEDWINKNNISCDKQYKSELNNFSREFTKEFKKKMEELIGYKLEPKMSISDEKRNIHHSGVVGWKGIDLKNIMSRSTFYDRETYQEYINERVEITNHKRNKLILKYTIQDFINWCNEKGIISQRKHQIQARGKYSNVFQSEFKKVISELTLKEFKSSSSYLGVAGVFIGLTSKGWDCKPPRT